MFDPCAIGNWSADEPKIDRLVQCIASTVISWPAYVLVNGTSITRRNRAVSNVAADRVDQRRMMSSTV